MQLKVQMIEMIIPWIRNCERIVCITSNSTAMFHRNESEEMPSSFLKALSSKPENSTITATSTSLLHVPNLITGFCAGGAYNNIYFLYLSYLLGSFFLVISYCQHVNKCAELYVCYIDPRPLDSLAAYPILELLKALNIPTDKPFAFKPQFTIDSNLYM